ncbi:MAG: hypothetical protein ACI8QZ_002294 [Chlamydiales bacterium]|jgi:hypothetical protein
MLLLPILLHSPVALASALPASDLDVTHISPDATWLIHVDVEALRSTEIWKMFRESLDGDGLLDLGRDELEELREFEQRFGFNPLDDVHAVTLSGDSDLGDDPLIVVETGTALDRALSYLQRQDEYRSTRRDGLMFHGWDGDGHGDDATFYVHEDGDRRVVVVGESEKTLTGAVDVLLGKVPNLSQNPDRRLFPKWSRGAFLVVDAAGILDDLARFQPASALAEMARGLSIEAGESRGEIYLTAHVTATDAEAAQKIFSVLNGARALASLAGAQGDVPPFALQALNALDLKVNGDDVSIQFHYNVRELVQELQELDEIEDFGGWDH